MFGIGYQRRHGAAAAAAVALSAVLLLAAPAGAQTHDSVPSLNSPQNEPPAAAWYVVGNVDRADNPGVNGFAGFDDRLVTGGADRRRVALGLTFSNAEADRTLDFTAPSPVLDSDAEDRFTFLVSGAYDWHTGTIVTPRFMAGVGISYLDPSTAPTRMRQDGSPGTDVTPAMQVGIGADVAISGALGLSAEYRASVRGATESGGAEQDPRVDQKFMIGAKLRF